MAQHAVPKLTATRVCVFAGLMIFAMGQTILFAVMGPAARDIGLAEWQVGAVGATSALFVMLVSPLWGRLSDRWGRKLVIVTGLLAYGLLTGLFAAVLAGGLAGWIGAVLAFDLLIAARILYALGTAGIQPAAVALMADLTETEDRSAGIALVGAAFGIGTVLGPALAAALVGFGVLTPLFAAAAAAIVVALVAVRVLADPPRAPARAEYPPPLDRLPRGLPLALVLTFLTYVAIATIQQTAAFFIQDFTWTGSAEAARFAGFAFVALALSMLVVQGGLVRAFKPSAQRMVGAGLPIAAAGLAVYLLAPGYGWIIAAFAIMGAGFGLVQPGISALVSVATGADAQGRAAGYVQAGMAGGFVVGPVAGTALYAVSPSAPLWLALASVAACAFVFGAMQWAALRRDRAQVAEGATV